MKRTKKFNQEWAEAIALLPASLQQSLTDAICAYQNDGISPQGLDPLAQALFIVIKPTIDARAKRSAYQKARRERLNVRKNRSDDKVVESSPVEIPMPVKEVKVSSNVDADLPSPKQSGGEMRRGVPSVPKPTNRFLRQVQQARQSRASVNASRRRYIP